MKFEDLEIGSIFSYSGYTYIKIDRIVVVTPTATLTFNAKDIDTDKAFQIHPDASVSLVPIRDEFERLWKTKSGSIDKALCYEFYKLGVNGK